jgi:hypothetical protein
MKKATYSILSAVIMLIAGLFFLNSVVKGQVSVKESPPLPGDISKIVTASCMPCHSSSGGFLSRLKLNFTDWTKYPAETQKKKASKIYSMLKKNAMPPKSAREANPAIVPTKDQIETIKKWSDSVQTGNN